MLHRQFLFFFLILAPILLVVVGCGGSVAADPSIILIAPGIASIDTSCTGCNAESAAVEQFTAKLADGSAAAVSWSLAGGDATSGPGSITANGQYTPPSYLTADHAAVMVSATLDSGAKATSVLTLTPGFLQPLTPENVALGAGGTVTISGTLAEAGGAAEIKFSLSNSATGQGGGLGTLGATSCQRGGQSFTTCSVAYTAPAAASSTGIAYVVASVGVSPPRASTVVLVNPNGVTSNPAGHQEQLTAPVLLGASGGNNKNYDASGNQIMDCCGGTLGALVEDAGKRQYLLSNNHVLAESDHARVGDAIIQPGLIDSNCTPWGDGANALPVAWLSGWLPLDSKRTNADAAIAQVASRAIDSRGSILELGARLADGTLAAAPPGISSTGGRGEAATLDLKVAKSGRTTGLTCGGVTALDLDVTVDYFLDCAETKPYLTKTFTHQLALSGNQFSDAGDSGALVVDAANAEPVGLYFAGGRDISGVSQGVANPATDVLNELTAQVGGGSYTFVGGADHPVSCLSYGDSTVGAAQARGLGNEEKARAQQALSEARMLVRPSAGILGVSAGKSNDSPGEGAIIFYTDEKMTVATPPATVGGVRTLLVPTSARAVAYGSAPLTPPAAGISSLPSSALAQALAVKQQLAASLMRRNPAFFGVGVGQSFDNPREAALVIYVDRKQRPAHLPTTVEGVRTRYVIMDRMHVTRSYAAAAPAKHLCSPAQTRRDPFKFLY